MNSSPVEGKIFAVTKSMQNVQRLTGAGGTAKYVCKYIAKIDEQNYVVVEVDGEGKMISKVSFLHNTKITSSKIAQDRERKKNANKNEGRVITTFEMLHVILQYPEIITNLNFVKVTTMPLEYRAGIKMTTEDRVEDGAFVTSGIDHYRNNKGFPDWRCHTANQNLLLDDVKLSKITIDKVTQFGLRPPEFLKLFSKLGDYYRWFVIISDKVPV